MDIVGFETAKKLKAAGFPEPDPFIGFFYVELRTPGLKTKHKWIQLIFVVYDKWSHIGFSDGGDTLFHPRGRWNELMEGDCIFAPTSADILRQIPNQEIYFDGEDFAFYGDMLVGGTSMAEVAAKKWLP